jgi:hypothetical protein
MTDNLAVPVVVDRVAVGEDDEMELVWAELGKRRCRGLGRRRVAARWPQGVVGSLSELSTGIQSTGGRSGVGERRAEEDAEEMRKEEEIGKERIRTVGPALSRSHHRRTRGRRFASNKDAWRACDPEDRMPAIVRGIRSVFQNESVKTDILIPT